MADKMWACWGNSAGLFFKEPRQVKKLQNLGTWWTSCGDYEAKKKGFENRGAWVCFASENKAEVKKFMQGYKACHDVIKYKIGF